MKGEHTVYDDEKIEFDLKTQLDAEKIKICCGGQAVAAEKNEGGCHVVFTPERLGEHRFEITVGDIHTYTDFFVSERPEKIMEKRIRFIIDKQQYHRAGSPLDGAFLIYDNKEKYHVFDSVIRDHNACRERTGMALLMARYLQIHEDAEIRAALDRCITFLMREFFDAQTGEVFDGVGRNKKFKRLYNAPWITTLFTEMYRLTGDKTYLHHIVKMLEVYYDGGGTKFYPNGLSMYKTVTAFKSAEMPQEAEKVIGLFTVHVNNMVKNGLSYPKHEVNYEQTIVSPAATFISEMARLTGDKKYTEEAQKHIAVLERFNGHQPSFHLHEIPIRFWDDFWFGKSILFGDTFPHYWSCLTARAFTAYYKASGDKEYLDAAEKCIRNCMCLFNDKGEGSCAYVYPFRLNGEKGQFYDEWANDQDFALYFYLVNKECCGT